MRPLAILAAIALLFANYCFAVPTGCATKPARTHARLPPRLGAGPTR